MNDRCIFCKIIQGEIPCERIYEDSDVLAFMDIGPIIKGHALVVPKEHWDPITEVPSGLLGRVMDAVQRVAAAQMTALHADGVNIHQANGAAAGQVIPHVHFHVIPRFNDDGHRWNWTPGAYASPAEMKEIAARLRGGHPGFSLLEK